MKSRATRQLTAIYDALAASSDHPTADQVYQRVRDRLPRLSLGTVYRNLDKLREQGRLRIVRLADGQARYDAMVDDHDHFVCERCGAVHDLPRRGRPAFSALREQGCVVRWHTTAIHGLCAACAAAAVELPA
ncbi:MAG: transcriptional repressor [Deltaproteobacteria bacterium]|nr:transcriptional repressor [Deltaproteobacteria bacterium]